MDLRRSATGCAFSAAFSLACILSGLSPTVLRGQGVLAAPTEARADLARAVDSLVRDVAERNPSVRAMRTGVEVAKARAEATGRREPLSLSAGLSEAPFSALDQGNLRLEIGREIGGLGRLRAERLLAEVEIREREVLLDATLRTMRADLIEALMEMATGQRVVERLTAEGALLDDAENGIRSRFAVGDARYVDVLRLRTEQLRVQSERAEAVASLRASRVRVRSLIGAVDPADTARSAVVDSMVSRTGLDAWRTLLPSTLDPRALESTIAEIQLADVAVQRAKAEQTLGVAARRTRMEGFVGAQRIGQASSGAALGPSVGFTMSLPRSASAANRSAQLAERAEVSRATAAQLAASAAVRARLEMAAEHYAAALERVDAFDAALLDGARSEREAALAAYRAQRLTLIELLDFERALARAEIDALRALADAARAYTTLISGGPDAESDRAPSPDSREEH